MRRSPNTPVEILRAAKRLIENPERWTQNAPARHATGEPCGSYSVYAVCWCAIGAIYKASAGSDAVEAAIAAMPKGFVDDNDTLGHAKTMANFDIGIANAESQGEVLPA